MRDTNGGTKTNTGVMENLELTIAGISIFVQWIIKKAPYCLLLGRPFQVAAQCDMEDIGETLIIFDPKKPGRHIQVPMTRHKAGEFHHTHLMLTTPPLFVGVPGQAALPGLLRVPSLLSANLPMASHYLRTVYNFTTPALGLKYKPVARKVRPVATTLSEAAQPRC